MTKEAKQSLYASQEHTRKNKYKFYHKYKKFTRDNKKIKRLKDFKFTREKGENIQIKFVIFLLKFGKFSS